jgi:hypothetical protein
LISLRDMEVATAIRGRRNQESMNSEAGMRFDQLRAGCSDFGPFLLTPVF